MNNFRSFRVNFVNDFTYLQKYEMTKCSQEPEPYTGEVIPDELNITFDFPTTNRNYVESLRLKGAKPCAGGTNRSV